MATGHVFYEQAFPMFGVSLGDDHVPPFETILTLWFLGKIRVKLFLKVVATCRSPDKSSDLAKLLDAHGQAPALPLDTTNPASLLKLVATFG